jgi:hypothetical protein
MKEHNVGKNSRKNKAEKKSQGGPSMFRWLIFTNDYYGNTLINRLPQLLHQTNILAKWCLMRGLLFASLEYTAHGYKRIRFFFRISPTRVALRVAVILIEEILILFGPIKQPANVSSFHKTYSFGAKEQKQLIQHCWIN